MRRLLFLLCATIASAHGADYDRERRWAQEVETALVVGEAHYLTSTEARKFLALYTPADVPRGGVLLVHGMGVHPDWGLIGVLRQSLIESGYSTLSLQMPVEAADAKADAYPGNFAEAAQRIAAGVAFLRAQGLSRIVIVSHSMGSRMAEQYLTGERGKVAGWVSVGITQPYGRLAGVQIPILDVYGEKDFPEVIAAAPARAAAVMEKQGSAQVRVPGADHFFAKKEKALQRLIEGFIAGIP